MSDDANAAALGYGHAAAQAYSPFYTHSGKVTLKGTALALLAGSVVAIFGAFVYAYVDLYCPLVYVNLLLCMGFGGAIGVVAVAALKCGKVRNVPVAMAVVFVLTLVAYYACWAVWEIAVLDRAGAAHPGLSHFNLMLHPDAVYRLGGIINKVGTWSMSKGDKENMSGIPLTCVWVCEAALIFGIALLVAKSNAGDRPFCERCNEWCSKNEVLAVLSPHPTGDVREMLLTRDWRGLSALIASFRAERTLSQIQVTHSGCSKCNELHTVSANDVKTKVDKKGKQETSTKTFVKQMRVTADEVAYFRGLHEGSVAVAEETA